MVVATPAVRTAPPGDVTSNGAVGQRRAGARRSQSGAVPRTAARWYDAPVRLLLNLIWIVLGGFLIWLEYVLGGLILCLTVVGIPFGLQCFKLAGLGLLPFGKEVVEGPAPGGSEGLLTVIMNVLWFVVAGLWICLTHLSLALGYALSIIGIPFALQHLKLALLALMPFGKMIRTVR